MDSSEDYPQLGERQGDQVLVCHGDDWPQEFAGWLYPLVDEFRKFELKAAEFGVDMDPEDESPPVAGVTDFCERLGIHFIKNMWQGSLISGNYHWGWIHDGGEESAAAEGRKLLRALRKHIDKAIRSEVIRELRDISDLDQFIDRTADDRHVLREEIASLRLSLEAANSALDAAEEKISKDAEFNSAKIDQACLQLASALLTGEKCRRVAGPLVLWDDGVVYAISTWGGSPIPEGSSPAVLLDAIQRSGRHIVLVSDATVIGGWLSGPRYRKGPANISGWSEVWSLREKGKRTFAVDPPEAAEQVRQIYDVLTSTN